MIKRKARCSLRGTTESINKQDAALALKTREEVIWIVNLRALAAFAVVVLHF